MPDYFAQDGGGDGGELEEAWGFGSGKKRRDNLRMKRMGNRVEWGGWGIHTDLSWTEFVEGSDEDGEGGVDADGPGEGKEKVGARDEDGGLGDCFGRADHGLPEGIAQMAGAELLDPDQAEDFGSTGWLFVRGDTSVVIGLV